MKYTITVRNAVTNEVTNVANVKSKGDAYIILNCLKSSISCKYLIYELIDKNKLKKLC